MNRLTRLFLCGVMCIPLTGCLGSGNPRVDVLLGFAKPAAMALLTIELEEKSPEERAELCQIVNRARRITADVDEVLEQAEAVICEEAE